MKKRPPVVEPLWDELFALLLDSWRTLHKLPGGPLDRLQTREFQNFIAAFQSYQETKDVSTVQGMGAYLLYDWPLQYAEAISLLRELPSPPQRVLELGTIGAPFSLAANQYGATEVFAIGPHERLLRIGASIIGKMGYTFAQRVTDCRAIRSLPITGKWDLIILPYFLFAHFSSADEMVSYISQVADLLTSEGKILIVESSQTATNRTFLGLRDKIALSPLPIIAPCLWKGSCPALKHGSSPCFAQRKFAKPFFIHTVQKACQITQNSLKMSYLLLGSPQSTAPLLPNNLYRVVSPPVETYKGERFFLCGVQGRKTLGSTLSEHPKQSRAFAYLQRGDVIAIEEAPELDHDLQIIPETKLSLYAPCDKPVIPKNES